MKFQIHGILGLALLAGFSALADARSGQEELALANTRFAFDLLKQIAGGQPDGNVFISPYSVSFVLQMTSDGAAGQTKDEMERVLHVNGLPTADAAGQKLNEAVTNGQADAVLKLANAIWYLKGLALKPAFAAHSANFFGAKIGAVDFASPQSAKIINEWAEKNTAGRIRDIVKWPMDPLTRVILANAIYFKGRWENKFDKNATKDHAFTLPGGAQTQVPMMRQSRHFAYFEGQGFQAARLPYAGGRLQMYLCLPAAGSSLKQWLNGLDGAAWQKGILPRFRDRQGLVMLPRFKLNYAVTLNQALEGLGMKLAFSERADFSAMSAEPMLVSAVKQKSFLEVDEEGTEAAAATTVTVRAMAIMKPEKPFEMILDRPFFFVIGDDATRSILFMGLVSNPAK